MMGFAKGMRSDNILDRPGNQRCGGSGDGARLRGEVKRPDGAR